MEREASGSDDMIRFEGFDQLAVTILEHQEKMREAGAEELLKFGDIEGYRLWQRIRRAIAESTEMPPNALRHE